MQVVRTIQELDAAINRRMPSFVPTMGALHEGHLALIRRAAECAQPVVVSVFVNPTQFAPHEDFTRYPRRLDTDVELAAAAGADVVFAPEIDVMYPPDEVPGMPPLPLVATQPQLEDAQRPGHFAGVCQVVARLFDIVQPGPAIFGEKDYQQLLVIRAMAHQQQSRWPHLQIIAHPTVREPDGLAMSSRNIFLDPHERDLALGLVRALQATKEAAAAGNYLPELEQIMRGTLHKHKLAVDYAVVRDASTLMPASTVGTTGLRGLIAVRLGKVRLIDNAAI